MDKLSGQYGFDTRTELKEAMYDTGKTKFGQGSARAEVLFGDDGLQAGATKEEFLDRIQEIGFSSDIANACWEVLNIDTDGDSADIIDEDEYNKLIAMYGSDFNGERDDELDEITVGSLYTFLSSPRDVSTSSSGDSSDVTSVDPSVTTEPDGSVSDDTEGNNDEVEGEDEDEYVNNRLISFMSNFIEDVNDLLNDGDVQFEDVLNLARSYDFAEFSDTEPTSAQEIEYRSQLVDKAISMYSYATTPEEISSLNDATGIVDVIYTSFDDNDLRTQKLQDLFETVSSVEIESESSGVDWGQYDYQQAFEQLVNGNYTNADILEMFNEKGGSDKVISEIMKLDSESQKKYLDALMSSILNVGEVQGDEPAEPEANEETDEFVRPASDDTPISDTSATYFADKINGGLPFQNMDYSALQDVLNNQNFSQEDIIEIWSKYSEKHGNLLENLNYSLNVTAKNQATEELANIAIEQAKAGNEEAISLLAKELKASSKNMKFAPDHFMSYFFENIDTKTLSIIVQEYSQLNDGDSMAKDIGGFISFGKVNDYVKQIEEAMSLL